MNWSRPAGETRWHSVVEVQPSGSVRTRCYGRWPTSLEREDSDDPPMSERCRACVAALLNAERPTTGVTQFDLSEGEDV